MDQEMIDHIRQLALADLHHANTQLTALELMKEDEDYRIIRKYLLSRRDKSDKIYRHNFNQGADRPQNTQDGRSTIKLIPNEKETE